MTDLGIARALQSRREALVSRLSPAARHLNFPKLYSRPVPTEAEPEAEPTALALEELVRAAVEKYMGSTGGDAIKRAVRLVLSEKASEWRSKKITDDEIAVRVVKYPIDRVVNVAADITGVPFDALRSPNRYRAVAWPRHFTMTLLHCARRDLSFNQIGKLFGNRDHTSVMHAVSVSLDRRFLPECESWYLDPRAVEIFSGTKYALAQAEASK